MDPKDIPAFPTAYKLNAVSRGDGGGANYEYETYGGMTLRDYFAAKAMQSLITVQFQTKQAQCAETAYEWADAMLKVRTE